MTDRESELTEEEKKKLYHEVYSINELVDGLSSEEAAKKIEDRKADVETFWETGVLNPTSNVQFGEGGAGTFSDGKLNTAVKDPSGRNQFVLETFVKFGAQSKILYENNFFS